MPVIKGFVIIVPNSSTDYELNRINAIDLTLSDAGWPFAVENAAAIAEHWAGCTRDNPALFNGNVFLMSSGGLEGSRLTAELIEVDYASFLTWRDWGWPDKTAHDLYGSAIVLSSDGAMLVGRMSPHTVNAGLLYPPGGSLNREDLLAGNKVDLFGSIARELAEETGLDAAEAEAGEVYMASFDQRIAIGQVLRFPHDAAELVRKFSIFLESEPDPELEQILMIRNVAELAGHKKPPHAEAFASAVLGSATADA